MTKCQTEKKNLVTPAEGIEPSTTRLRAVRSTTELYRFIGRTAPPQTYSVHQSSLYHWIAHAPSHLRRSPVPVGSSRFLPSTLPRLPGALGTAKHPKAIFPSITIGISPLHTPFICPPLRCFGYRSLLVRQGPPITLALDSCLYARYDADS